MPRRGDVRTSSEDAVLSALTTEAELDCPHCGERITIVIDLSIPEQTYIEDCFVCCRPINVHCTAEAGELIAVTADPAS